MPIRRAQAVGLPDTATISDVHTETSTLDINGRDFFLADRQRAAQGRRRLARISVLNVSGMANAPSEVGTTIQDDFDCRAYFVDGALAHTLVVFDHAH